MMGEHLVSVTETPCHCGSPMGGSDHCPECGCEQHEGTCSHVFSPSFFCGDCGVEMFEVDVLRAVRQTGAFKGICIGCVEQRAREGETITVWENRHDEWGFNHNHEVPAFGQFRLRSACAGCDELDDLVNAS